MIKRSFGAKGEMLESDPATFRQFTYCQICRTNHDEGDGHVYVKRHREAITKILAKFRLKVKEASATIKQPVIQESSAEMSAKLWCYCCECEVPRNATEDGLVILHSGTLEHLRSLRHFRKAKSFWWKNRIDRKLLDDYVVKDESYSDFRINVLKAIAEFKRRKAALQQQEVSHILVVEEMRKKLLNDATKEESVSNLTNGRWDARNGESSKTPEVNLQGNIFTGMTPPWLQKVEKPADSKNIGPSLTDYQKHLEVLRKSKLPANRVGATFDRDAAKSSSWLPAFGRVWNNSRRKASKQEFQRRGHKRPHLESSEDQNGAHVVRHHQPVSGPPPNINKYIL